MNIAKIMALTEASSGYNGGSYVDEMPHLSLTEAAGQLSMFLMESQIDLSEATVNNNESLVEAAVSAMQTGTPADFDSLVEASWADIKAKIVKIMDKIKKFIDSIIAKLTLFIDKVRMNGHQLYEKYKDAAVLKDTSKFKDMKVEGYKFSKNEKLFPALTEYLGKDGAEALIKKADSKFSTPSEFYKEFVGKSEKAAKSNAIDKIKDVSKRTRSYNMAKVLTGSSKITEDNWQADLKQELYGDKVELKYGTDFTLDSIAELLKEPKNLNLVREDYVKLSAAVKNYKDDLQKHIDEIEREISKMKEDGNKTGLDAEGNMTSVAGMSLVSSYYNAYMSLVSDSYGTINIVENIKYNYEKEKLDQAKILFGKMLSFKAKKDNNDASDVDSDIEYEIEL